MRRKRFYAWWAPPAFSRSRRALPPTLDYGLAERLRRGAPPGTCDPTPIALQGQTLGGRGLRQIGTGSIGCSCVPDGTRSFAVTLYDPDAPTGSGWWHWVVYNLPTSTTSLAPGAGSGEGLPAEATQGRTDFGSTGYGGPCPPKGDEPHRYVFTVYALDVPNLDIPPEATAARVGFSLNAHALDRPTLTGRYSR